MAFKMKNTAYYKKKFAGSEMSSPYNRISNDDKKHRFKESEKRKIEDKERREKTNKELYPVTLDDFTSIDDTTTDDTTTDDTTSSGKREVPKPSERLKPVQQKHRHIPPPTI